jgi:hypothetical protein
MKLTGKEDDELMRVVSNWWNTELAEHQCWHIALVPGRGKLLVCFKNKPAGDQHAVSAFLRHQGCSSMFPCIWCEVRDMTGSNAECGKCGRHSCQHSPFAGIDAGIVALQTVSSEELGREPEWFKTAMKVSHNVLKPRREAPAQGAAKAAEAQAYATSSKSKQMPRERKTKACGKGSRCEADVVPQTACDVTQFGPEVQPSSAQPSRAKLSPLPSPLEPNFPLKVHPHVRLC